MSNGSAVLGLGNLGASASLPVMEGKAVLFKEFADVDAFPICLDESDPDKLVENIKKLAPIFGSINLEDIKVVVNGAGAAGASIVKLLNFEEVGEIIALDIHGAIYRGSAHLDESTREIAEITNPQNKKGDLADIIKDADVFIGVSAANLLYKKMVRSMAADPIIFAMANPEPEIWPEDALKAGARIVGTGRSDYPNQVNNVLAFPGIFRGALDVRAKEINKEMKQAAAYALADLIAEDELEPDYVIPKPFDPRVGPHVAAAVAQAAIDTGAARIEISYEDELENARKIMEK